MTDALYHRLAILPHAAAIVVAFVSRNPTRADEMAGLTADVHGALLKIVMPPEPTPEAAPLVPAVPVNKSVFPDHIVCLEDGKKFRSLKRHLGTVYNLTPGEYRAKWGLPSSYPMVCGDYSARRIAIAKDMGLGRKDRPAPHLSVVSPAEPAPASAAA